MIFLTRPLFGTRKEIGVLIMQTGAIWNLGYWLKINHDIALLCRFVDRDAFARFAGIGIGCQRFQASQVLNIQVGPDHTFDPQSNSGEPVESELNESDSDMEDN